MKDNLFVLDAHFDLLSDAALRRGRGERKVIERMYMPDLMAGGVSALVASIFVEDMYLPEMGLRMAMSQIASLHREAEETDRIVVCTSASDFRKAHDEGKLGIMLSFEGAEPVFSIDSLLLFYKLGVRGLGLCWSRPNRAAEGIDFSGSRKKGGLTGYGEELVDEAVRLGMFIDISHLSDEGVESLMAHTSAPFIASHSNARALTPANRNLPDEFLEEIALRGGVVGINACSSFVDEESPDMQKLADHLEYLISKLGEDKAGLGFDLCDVFYQNGAFTGARKNHDVLESHRMVPEFLGILRGRGFSEDLIRKIAGENWLSFYDRYGVK